MTIKKFNGETAFLNGTDGLHEFDQKIYDKFIELGLGAEVIDNLFHSPDKLTELKKFKNLVIFTTGMFPEKIRPLIKIFENCGAVPENVIFLSEDSALTLIGIARELAEKGTKFWFIDPIDKYNLYPIEWI